jgi:hypothetical protein
MSAEKLFHKYKIYFIKYRLISFFQVLNFAEANLLNLHIYKYFKGKKYI